MEPKEVVFVLGGPGSGKGTHVSPACIASSKIQQLVVGLFLFGLQIYGQNHFVADTDIAAV